MTPGIKKMASALEPHEDVGYWLDVCYDVADQVASNVGRIYSDRQIPVHLANEIADKGLFRLLVPKSLGGTELDYPDFLRLLKVFAEVDASTAWCVNQINVFGTDSVKMPKKIAKTIWSEHRAVVANGPPSRDTKAKLVPGGYKLSGQWNFSSGSTHATWFAALTPIEDKQQTKVGTSRPEDEPTVMLIPKQDVSFIDCWHVDGLRGTGSYSFEVENLYVPKMRTYRYSDASRENGTLYVIPKTLMFGAGDATIALGVARSSLRAVQDLARAERPNRYGVLLKDDPVTHRTIGKAEAIWQSATALLEKQVASVWESAQLRHALSIDERVGLRLAITNGIRMAADVVDVSYNLCGSSSVFTNNPVHRHFQDIHVITQHAQANVVHYDTAGQLLLGLEPNSSMGRF